jgi:hypothetical protein
MMRRIRPTLLVLFSLWLLPTASARAATIVAPNGYETVEGNDGGSFPFTNFTGRYQQAYASSEFASGQLSITEIAFRTDALQAATTWLNEMSFTLRLSTSANPVGSLSTTFADNIGADDTLVYTASTQPFGGSNAGAPGPNAFDLVLALDTPFVYDPGAGDLLMEVLMSGNTKLLPASGIAYLDAVASENGMFDVGLQRVWNSTGGTAALTGSTDLDGFGLVTRFTYEVVPEPGTGLLLIAGLLGIAVRRRV